MHQVDSTMMSPCDFKATSVFLQTVIREAQVVSDRIIAIEKK